MQDFLKLHLSSLLNNSSTHFALQDDANWWQATLVDYPNEPAKLVPSRELEERRRAFVRPEADYTTKVGS